MTLASILLLVVGLLSVTLDVTTRGVVTNISNSFNTPLTITYSLSATVLAGVMPTQSRTVTLTLANYP